MAKKTKNVTHVIVPIPVGYYDAMIAYSEKEALKIAHEEFDVPVAIYSVNKKFEIKYELVEVK